MSGDVNAGTYWLTLSGLKLNPAGFAFWDVNDGPSTAYVMNTNIPPIPSEYFQIQGFARTPELRRPRPIWQDRYCGAGLPAPLSSLVDVNIVD